MTDLIHVYSEIGKLKTVMLHRPGKELENLSPDILMKNARKSPYFNAGMDRAKLT